MCICVRVCFLFVYWFGGLYVCVSLCVVLFVCVYVGASMDAVSVCLCICVGCMGACCSPSPSLSLSVCMFVGWWMDKCVLVRVCVCVCMWGVWVRVFLCVGVSLGEWMVLCVREC